MNQLSISQLRVGDPGYPDLLKESKKPPELLYYSGAMPAACATCISVIGSRGITAYGHEVISLLIPPLVQAGLSIVSGLAYGVDSQAQKVALHYGGTCVAVLGSGLHAIYPASHGGLAAAIVQAGGCVISEYPADMKALAYHFPCRNRIVAALSPVTLIIEAGEKSGTLITARYALEAGREVCVVPADITRVKSYGAHQLLKEGARPVTGAQDIMALYAGQLELRFPTVLRPALTGSLACLYDLISQGATTADDLLLALGWRIEELQSVLSVLELDGYIAFKGTTWQRI